MKSVHSILLAEDDTVLRKLYSHVLKLGGYLVTAAANGYEALDYARERAFDLVIIDVMMPKMDGLDLCRALRDEYGSDTPILFITALDDVDTLRRCRAAGADDYLVKEGSPDSLLERVNYWRRYREGELNNGEMRPSLQDVM